MGHIFDFWSCSLIWRYFVIWRSILGHDMFNRPTENSTKKIVKPCWWHFDDIKSLIWDETELKGTIFKWRAADFPYFVFGAQSTRVQWRRLRARFGPVHYGAWGARYTPAPERVLERGTVANEISNRHDMKYRQGILLWLLNVFHWHLIKEWLDQKGCKWSKCLDLTIFYEIGQVIT